MSNVEKFGMAKAVVGNAMINAIHCWRKKNEQ